LLEFTEVAYTKTGDLEEHKKQPELSWVKSNRFCKTFDSFHIITTVCQAIPGNCNINIITVNTTEIIEPAFFIGITPSSARAPKKNRWDNWRRFYRLNAVPVIKQQ